MANSQPLPINTILTLLRRGETIEWISCVLGIQKSDVEAVMEKYISRLA